MWCARLASSYSLRNAARCLSCDTSESRATLLSSGSSSIPAVTGNECPGRNCSEGAAHTAYHTHTYTRTATAVAARRVVELGFAPWTAAAPDPWPLCRLNRAHCLLLGRCALSRADQCVIAIAARPSIHACGASASTMCGHGSEPAGSNHNVDDRSALGHECKYRSRGYNTMSRVLSYVVLVDV